MGTDRGVVAYDGTQRAGQPAAPGCSTTTCGMSASIPFGRVVARTATGVAHPDPTETPLS